MRRWLVFLLILPYFLTDGSGSGIRLNVPRVRLPYFETLSVNFTLHVDTPGCYKWRVSRSDVIVLKKGDGTEFESDDDDECSEYAVISTVPRLSPCCPSNAIVYAEELYSQEIVRCDVIVDKIVSIKIVTTTKELHLEEAPSKFNVRGYGTNNNEFSTLEGIPFKWWFSSPPKSIGSHNDLGTSLIRFLPFSESLYEVSRPIAALEERRQQGSQVLVEGIKTGAADVFAKLVDPYYKNIPAADVRIVVVANLLLDPHEAYIVPETIIGLKLMQMKLGKLFEIKLPSDVYSFEVTNSSVAEYNPKISTITALQYGSTQVIVRDKNNLGEVENELTNALTAYIYVREPKFLSLVIKPHKNWALAIGENYEISVEVYDANNSKIFISNNMFIKTKFEKQYFRVDSSSSNGTYHVGITIRTGLAKVSAELHYITKRDGTRFIPISPPRVQGEMEIFQRIALTPSKTILPWDPSKKPRHEINYKPSGGSGNFAWSSTNNSFVIVTQNGKATTENYGYANVTAAMTINSNVKGYAKVYVLLPESMKIIDHIIEAEVGTPILIPLAFYVSLPDEEKSQLYPFSTCRNLDLQIDIEDPSFSFDSTSIYPHSKPACVYLPILSTKLGSTLVRVSYEVGDRKFSDSVTVSTFMPLRVVEPKSGEVVLPVGSSLQVVFGGGPRPLLDSPSDFTRTLSIANETVGRRIGTVVRDEIVVYEILCREIGETVVGLQTGNKREGSGRIPVLRSAEIRLICAEPSKISFKIDSLTPKCPDLSSTASLRIPMSNYEEIKGIVVVKDKEGRKFDNITSLRIGWRGTPNNLVSYSNGKFIETERVGKDGYIVPGKNIQTIIPNGKSGSVEITAEIAGYRTEVLKYYGIKTNIGLKKIESDEEYMYQRSISMDLQLVSDPSVKSSFVHLFNHPSSRAEVQIIEGSGYFQIISSPSTHLSHLYFESNKTILLSPLREGDGKIEIMDLCLANRPSISVPVRVNGVKNILLSGGDKVQVGSNLTLTLTLLDNLGSLLPPSALSLLTLTPLPLSPIISLSPTSNPLIYTLRGEEVGEGTVSFEAEGPGGRSESERLRVRVYSGLRLRPREVVLLVGSVYQVEGSGGPVPDSYVEYREEESKIVDVSNNGVVQGHSLGVTKVIGRAVDVMNNSLIYSSDEIIVKVVELDAIRIHCPSTQVITNAEMPLWAVGVSNGVDLPLEVLFGGDEGIISFEWILNEHYAEIETPFSKFGIIASGADKPIIRFKALRVGSVTIKLYANMSRNIFIAETHIEIIDELRLVSYSLPYIPLLLAPNSEVNLRTNRESSGGSGSKLRYSSHDLSDSNLVTFDPVVKVLRSGDKEGDSVLYVTYRGELGQVETLIYGVEVRPIRYLLTTPSLAVTLGSTTHVKGHGGLPVGLTFPLTLSFHDRLGRVFSGVNVGTGVRLTRGERLSVERVGSGNVSYEAVSSGQGRVGVKIFSESKPELRDYLLISISEAIQPSIESGKLGDVICFSCSIKSYSNEFGGHWSGSPSSNILIEPSNGRAVLISPGPCKVQYSVPGVGVVSSLDLTIRPINKIGFRGSSSMSELIARNEEGFRVDVPVKLGDKYETRFNCDSNTSLPNLVPYPFTCTLQWDKNTNGIEVEELFTSSPIFISEKGVYACRIEGHTKKTKEFHGSIVESSLVLTASVIQSEPDFSSSSYLYQEQTFVTSSPLTVQFLPTLFIHSKILQVSSESLTTSLFITGRRSLFEQIMFTGSHSNLVEIEKYGTEVDLFELKKLPQDQAVNFDKLGPGAETRQFNVRIKLSPDDLTLPLSLNFNSPATKQKINIPIRVQLGSSFSPKSFNVLDQLILPLPSWLISIFTILAGLIIYLYIQGLRLRERVEKTTSESVFVTSPSKMRTSTPKTKDRLFSSDLSGYRMGDLSPPQARRLYSTQDSGFPPYRMSDSSTPGSQKSSPMQK